VQEDNESGFLGKGEVIAVGIDI